MHTLRVGVFMGGRSIENEASFNSGRTICDHLDAQKYEVVPIFQRRDGKLFLLPWHFVHRGKTTDFEHRLETQAQPISWHSLKQAVDFIYLAIHGRYAEDGCLQGFLDILGIPYLGSGIFTSALCMDKQTQKHFLQAHGFQVPQGVCIEAHEIASNNSAAIEQKLTEANIQLPYIVKPYKEGSSFGVSKVHQRDELKKAVEKACFIQPGIAQAVLIEECIQGMEFSCIVLQDHLGTYWPLPITEIVLDKGTDFFDYEQKYMPGKSTKFTPARCSPEQTTLIQDTCVRLAQTFSIKTIARIDGFLTEDNRVIIIDPNTLSGMAPTGFIFRQAAEVGMNHTALINYIIETALRQAQDRRHNIEKESQ